MPVIRPFRALRFDPDAVGDMSDVVSPPYDVIDEAEQRQLLARHPRNVVRLDLPANEPGEDPDERYRRAARTLAAWRSDGTLRKDPRPSIYVYEQSYTVPGSSLERTQRGFFGRVRLEPFGPGSGVIPHERTMSGPKEDRYRLLRATGVNTSPVVGLYHDEAGRSAGILATITAAPPAVDLADADGTRHRLWAVPDDGDPDGPVGALTSLAGGGPITIADGHHRYETALRYRDERRMSRSCEEDPAFDYLLMLLLDAAAEPLTVLPTHRVVLGLGDPGVRRVLAGIRELCDISPMSSGAELAAAFEPPPPSGGGRGRLGLWTRDGGGLAAIRPGALDSYLPQNPRAVHGLDVVRLGLLLEHLAGIDTTVAAGGGRLAFTKSAAEAIERVERGAEGADAAFLLEPTPVGSVVAVAREGDVMPQKSTYFYPKALTGLVINPLEW